MPTARPSCSTTTPARAALGGDVVALGLAEAKRCANLVHDGFRLIFEEGQAG